MSMLSRILSHGISPPDLEDAFESIERLRALTEELDAHEQDAISREKLLRIATNDIDIALWGKDINSRFVIVNNACAEKILKTTPEAALNLTDEDFEHDALAQACTASDKIVQETMETHRFIEHAVYNDGHSMWIDTIKSPWVVDEKLIGTVGSARDITEFVPDDIKEKYKEPGQIEIPVDVMYAARDIRTLLEKWNKVPVITQIR